MDSNLDQIEQLEYLGWVYLSCIQVEVPLRQVTSSRFLLKLIIDLVLTRKYLKKMSTLHQHKITSLSTSLKISRMVYWQKVVKNSIGVCGLSLHRVAQQDATSQILVQNILLCRTKIWVYFSQRIQTSQEIPQESLLALFLVFYT